MSNCCDINVRDRDKSKLLCLIFLGLIATVLAISVIKYFSYKPVQPSPSSNKTLDYLVLSVTWPISFCRSFKKEKNCTHKCVSEDNWIIHGFWPNKNNRSVELSHCSKSPFNDTEIESIRYQMEEYWPTKNNCYNNSGFWEHEWSKHGTCALQLEPLNTQLKYFQRTLELYKEYNVTEALRECNIHPNDSTLYQKDDIVDCFSNHFNVSPQLSCKTRKGNKTFLEEIRLCFNKELILQDCKTFSAQKDNCNGSLIYPAQL
ncbi:ribonuclease T2-like [Planococcus citri]|uniref:ribonuclease T2-like n=1 Tax=Planococcus citri TaxID=170843 RepID=UPI0031F85A74